MSSKPPDDTLDDWRGGRITDPDAFDETGRAKHEYCTHCGLVLHGPHKGNYWPVKVDASQRVQAADDERTYTPAEAEAAHKLHNVNGFMCPDCVEAWRKDALETIARRKAERDRREREQALKASPPPDDTPA